MSSPGIPPFEILAQGMTPYSGFGPIVGDEETKRRFSRVVADASARISETFEVSPSADQAGVETLEELVSGMWREGWDPETADVNLFVRDLGSLFMSIIQDIAGGEAVFRSQTDLSHASLWWPDKRLEVFPFHKMYRRLLERDGESLAFFVKGLTKRLAP